MAYNIGLNGEASVNRRTECLRHGVFCRRIPIYLILGAHTADPLIGVGDMVNAADANRGG
jgi:hypothetical protein